MGGGGSMFDPQVSPFDSSLIFVACDMTGLYRSVDAGESWTLLDTRTVEGSSRFSVAFDPTRAGHLVAFHRLLGLRFSGDGGASWSAYTPAFPQRDPNGNPLEVTAAAFAPDGRLLVGTTVGPYRYDGGMWTLKRPDASGGSHDVVDSSGQKVATVNDNDVVRFAFVRDASGVIDLVATINHLYRWNTSSRTKRRSRPRVRESDWRRRSAAGRLCSRSRSRAPPAGPEWQARRAGPTGGNRSGLIAHASNLGRAGALQQVDRQPA
jgi:hypothetical protein